MNRVEDRLAGLVFLLVLLLSILVCGEVYSLVTTSPLSNPWYGLRIYYFVFGCMFIAFGILWLVEYYKSKKGDKSSSNLLKD